jgi:hypothetical protein
MVGCPGSLLDLWILSDLLDLVGEFLFGVVGVTH